MWIGTFRQKNLKRKGKNKMSEKGETAAPKKEKAEKKKKEKGVYTLYKIEKDKIVRLRPTCERCGPGYFMADHGDRYTCGHCGFTRYKHA